MLPCKRFVTFARFHLVIKPIFLIPICQYQKKKKKNRDHEIGLQQMSGKMHRLNERSQWEKSFEFLWQSSKKKTASQKVLNSKGAFEVLESLQLACCKRYQTLKTLRALRNAHSYASLSSITLKSSYVKF